MHTVPEISVIMSVYNGEDYLEEAVESVMAQTFSAWELIIINDCSTDKTPEILQRLAEKDARIKVHTNETNLRLPTSLNKAISFAQGKYVARMDADDICLPNRLEAQFAFMEQHPEVALSSCRFMTLKNGVIASGGCGGKCDNASIRALLLVTNPILHPGIIAKTEVMRDLGYDTTLTCTEDLELWTRFAMHGHKMEIQPQYLMLYRLHDKQITETTKERQRREVVGIQKKYYGKFLSCMEENQEDFYINGIYFRDNKDIRLFCDFCRYMKAENKKTKAFDQQALSYALFEILAEYKRRGIKKAELVKAMLQFDIAFLLKELPERKKRAREDGQRCIEAAKSIGLAPCGGTPEFPVFQSSADRSE